MSYTPYPAGANPPAFSQPGFNVAPGGAMPQPSPGYPQPGGGYPQPGGGYPQPGGGYPQPGGGYPQPGGGYPQPGGGYPQPGYPQPAGGFSQPNVPAPVMVQPTIGGMASPAPMPHSIPGLEYLTQVDQLLVHQEVELLEAFIGFETANKYTVKNSMGQQVFYAVEDTGCCNRNCCGSSRPFDMKIMDHRQQEVIHLDRPLRCQTCWCPCFLQELEVTSGGTRLGMVKQNWSICGPSFDVLDSAGKTVLKIEGPFCTYAICGGDVEFSVKTASGSQQVGRITKQWSGLAKEVFTDADNFGVNFPIDLDVKTKATLLAATFLIDFMFFEKSGNRENDGIGMLG